MARRTSAHLTLPHDIGRYQLLVPIASGGMATVYLALARAEFGFERQVAVKLIHPHLQEAEFKRSLVEEAKLAARIRHPNVVQTIDVGEDDVGIYLVMDYVEGGPLRRLMEPEVGMPVGVLLRLLVDSLRGLHAAHELRDEAGVPLDVVHRDFTPHNILVGLDGVARLADFGIAKAAGRSGHTATGVIKGKYGYMAPEQAMGRAVDRRCDVWAAGVIAWEIVARRCLHGTDSDAATLLAIVSNDAPLLSSVAPSVPVTLDAVVAQALCRDVRARIASAEALATSLERACAGTDIELAPPTDVAEEVRRALEHLVLRRREQLAQAAASERMRRATAPVTDAADAAREAGSSGADELAAARGDRARAGAAGAERPVAAATPLVPSRQVSESPASPAAAGRSVGGRRGLAPAIALLIGGPVALGVAIDLLRSQPEAEPQTSTQAADTAAALDPAAPQGGPDAAVTNDTATTSPTGLTRAAGPVQTAVVLPRPHQPTRPSRTEVPLGNPWSTTGR